MSEQAEALCRIKEIGHGARLRAPMPLQDWKNTVVRMEREAEEALAFSTKDSEALRKAAQELIEIVSDDYGYQGDEADEEHVGRGTSDSELTFGHIRRLIAALSEVGAE